MAGTFMAPNERWERCVVGVLRAVEAISNGLSAS